MKRTLLKSKFFAFEDLDVYQLSVDLVAVAYQYTADFPETERFGLTNQIRRAATSVSLNIAEGRGRGTDKDFARFLYHARGSVLEVVSGFHLAQRLAFVREEAIVPLMKQAHILASKITALIQRLELQ